MTLHEHKETNNLKWTVTYLLPLLAAAMFIAGLIWAAAVNNERLDKGYERLDRVEPIVINNDKRISVVENDLKYIKEGVDDIKKELRSFKKSPNQ